MAQGQRQLGSPAAHRRNIGRRGRHLRGFLPCTRTRCELLRHYVDLESSTLTQLNGKEGLPPAVSFLDTESLLFGIGIKWGFPAGSSDTQRTELWYSEGTDLGNATKLADLAYPQNEYVMQGLRAGQQFYFWARLVDRSSNLGPFFL